MKAYLLVRYDYGDDEMLGVYSTLEKAMAAYRPNHAFYWQKDEHPLQPEVPSWSTHEPGYQNSVSILELQLDAPTAHE